MSDGVRISGPGADCAVEQLEPSLVCVRFQGELDAYSVPVLELALAARLAELCEHVRVDLTEVTFLDSAGIRLVLMLVRRARRECQVELIPPTHRSAARALELVGLVLRAPTAPPAPAREG